MKAKFITFGIVNAVLLGYLLACGIVWLLMGADNLDKGCVFVSDGDPNIAVWLVVMGSVLIGTACVQTLILPCMCRPGVRQRFPGGKVFATLWYPFFLCSGLFQFVWLIVGAIRLSETPCPHDTPVYKTTLAAVIIGFVMSFFNFCVYPGRSKFDD